MAKTVGSQVTDGIVHTADVAATGQGGTNTHENTGDDGLDILADRREAEGELATQAGGDESATDKSDTDNRTGIVEDGALQHQFAIIHQPGDFAQVPLVQADGPQHPVTPVADRTDSTPGTPPGHHQNTQQGNDDAGSGSIPFLLTEHLVQMFDLLP